MTNVSVLGAGNVGFALSAHLAMLGHHVTLFAHPDFAHSIVHVKETKEIVAIEEEGRFKAALHGRGRVAHATDDIKEAVDFADILVLALPAYGQLPVFELAMPHLRDGHVVVSMPGNFAALRYGQAMVANGCRTEVAFLDAETAPYACRKLRGDKVFISGMKRMIYAGVYPAAKTDAVLSKCRPLFTAELHRVANVLEAAISNINMTLHPPTMIHNAGWIEATEGDFGFYADAMSPAVCRVIDGVDGERMLIAEALDINTKGFIEIFKQHYGYTAKKNTSYEHIHYAAFHKYFRGPRSLDHRYLNEDMCYLLIPLRRLARAHNVATPVIDALVVLGQLLVGTELKAEDGFDLIIRQGEGVDKMHERLNGFLMD